MRAVSVVPGTRQGLKITDAPDVEASADHAVVRVLEAGICGTDVEITEGLYGEAPPGSPFLILGHENLGVVEYAPPGASVAAGDLVVSTVRRPCPELCAPCASDQNDMCLTGHFRERGISGLHGFMSERYAEAPRYLVKLPHSLRRFAVLSEPMSVVQKGLEQALRIQQRMEWTPRVAVVLGAGPVGLLAAAALRLRGIDVTVVARECRGGTREALIADAGIHYICTEDVPFDQIASKLPPIDLVFEATGAAAMVFPATRLLGPDGVCILTSVTGGNKSVEIDVASWNRDIVLGNRLVFGTVNAARRHFEMGVRDMELAEARLPGWLRQLVTRRLPFTDAQQGLHRGPDDIKTVLEFN